MKGDRSECGSFSITVVGEYRGEDGSRRQQQLRCDGGGASELSIQPSAVCYYDRHSDKNGERRNALGTTML